MRLTTASASLTLVTVENTTGTSAKGSLKVGGASDGTLGKLSVFTHAPLGSRWRPRSMTMYETVSSGCIPSR